MGNPLRLPATPGQDLLDQYRQVLAGWPVPHEARRLPTRAGDTFVLACGDALAPPLVLLHGAQANAAAWMAEAAAWSRHFRVYLPDLPGEPGLSAPRRPDIGMYAPWLDDVLDGLGLERAAFVGVSFGGWVALDYAVRQPQRVARLALLCPGGIGRQKRFLLKALPLLLLGRWGAARVRRMIMGPAPAQAPEAVRPVQALMERILAEVRPRTEPIPILSDCALQGLRMPLQVTVGARDPLIDSLDTARRLARWTPHAQVRLLPEGHHVLAGTGGSDPALPAAGTGGSLSLLTQYAVPDPGANEKCMWACSCKRNLHKALPIGSSLRQPCLRFAPCPAWCSAIS